MKIRTNSFKQIAAILSNAVLIREVYIGEMDDKIGTITKERVLEMGKEHGFNFVSVDNHGILRCNVHQNWSFVAYPSIEAARNTLTSIAFAKYFPSEAI